MDYMNAPARMAHDGEQNVATVMLIVITIGIGCALFALAKNNLLPIIQQAGNDLNKFGSDSHTWGTTAYTPGAAGGSAGTPAKP